MRNQTLQVEEQPITVAKRKRTDNDVLNITHKTKDRITRT